VRDAVLLRCCCCSAELVLDAAVPLPGNSTGKVKLLRKAGVKVDIKF
jgi:hypothetical protein